MLAQGGFALAMGGPGGVSTGGATGPPYREGVLVVASPLVQGERGGDHQWGALVTGPPYREGGASTGDLTHTPRSP